MQVTLQKKNYLAHDVSYCITTIFGNHMRITSTLKPLADPTDPSECYNDYDN